MLHVYTKDFVGNSNLQEAKAIQGSGKEPSFHCNSTPWVHERIKHWEFQAQDQKKREQCTYDKSMIWKEQRKVLCEIVISGSTVEIKGLSSKESLYCLTPTWNEPRKLLDDK